MKTTIKRTNQTKQTEGETILIAVTGMSPAILTETVWALADEKPPVIPDLVVAITTAGGRARLEADLCEPKAEFGGMCVWESLRGSDRGAGPANR